MATTFITGINVRPGRTPLVTARDSIAYIINPEKTQNGKLVTAFRCSPATAHFEIVMEQHEYEQRTGRKVIEDYAGRKKSYLLITMRQSFAPGEVTPETAHEIGCKLAEQFLGDKYQYVVATHVDKHCVHNHITFNIVGSDMKKFHQTKYTHRRLSEISDNLCKEYGLTVVVPSQDWQKRKYTNDRQTSFRTILKSDIDQAISAAKSYDEFLQLMNEKYRIDSQMKYLKFRHRTNGQQRYIRSYSLGAAYTEQNIRARIAGEHVPALQKSNSHQKAVVEELHVTYTQRLRNVEAMLHASGFLHEYGGDFAAMIQDISGLAEDAKDSIAAAQRELSDAHMLLNCLKTVEQYQSIADEYQFALLKERYGTAHRSELESYTSAVSLLQNKGISIHVPYRQYEDRVQTLNEQIDTLQMKYDSLQNQIEEVNQVQKLVEKVQNDEPILTERKRGKNHGRG